MKTDLVKFFKKHGATAVVLMFLILLLVSPKTKSFFLQQLLATGVFNATITNDVDHGQNFPTAVYAFKDVEGNLIDSEQLKGKVVFINFWASWCPPCRAEMPSMYKMYQQLKTDERIVFLFINEDDNLQAATQFLSKGQYDLPIHKRAGALSQEVFSGSLPTTVIINKEGKIVLKHQGMANYNSSKFISQMKSLL